MGAMITYCFHKHDTHVIHMHEHAHTHMQVGTHIHTHTYLSSNQSFYRLIAGYWVGVGDHEVPRG